MDIFIRKVNKNKIKKYIMSKNISLFETSSTNNNFINQFDKKFNKKSKKKIIFLDSNHTKDHVLLELNIYSKMIKKSEFHCGYGYSY